MLNFLFSLSNSKILLLLSWKEASLRLSIAVNNFRFSSSNLKALAVALLVNCSDKLASFEPIGSSISLSDLKTDSSCKADLAKTCNSACSA